MTYDWGEIHNIVFNM